MKKLPVWIQDWINLPVIILKAFKLRRLYKKNGFRIAYYKEFTDKKELPYKIAHWILSL